MNIVQIDKTGSFVCSSLCRLTYVHKADSALMPTLLILVSTVILISQILAHGGRLYICAKCTMIARAAKKCLRAHCFINVFLVIVLHDSRMQCSFLSAAHAEHVLRETADLSHRALLKKKERCNFVEHSLTRSLTRERERESEAISALYARVTLYGFCWLYRGN